MFDSGLTISWSALRAWEECKYKHKLRGKKSPTTNIRGYFHGTVVDRVMRDWLMDPDAQPGDMVEAVEEKMRQEELEAIRTGDGVVRWKHPGDKKEMLEFCTELVRRLEPILNEEVLPYPYEPARRFRTPYVINGLYGDPVIIYLAGEFDVVTKPDSFKVWDLKGTKDNSYWRKTMGQLIFYDRSVEHLYNEGPTSEVGLIQPMCDERVMRWTITDEQRADLHRRIEAMAHSIWRKEWDFTDVKGRPVKEYVCNGCFVRHACPKFQPVQLSAARKLSLHELRNLTTELNAGQLLEGSSEA